MRLYINIKQIGSRKPLLAKQELHLDTIPNTLRDLIKAIVTINVNEYNCKVGKNNGQDQVLDQYHGHPQIIHCLTVKDIDDKAAAGKVSFGEIYNDKMASLHKALETAFLAYEDGIYRVFINEQEAGQLDESISIKEEDVLTFVRLTMLSGRMW